MKKRMVITDFDGTLLNSEHKVDQADFYHLEQLGQKNIVRVIATGRSLFSLQKVITEDFPIDFIIFSSGAGIYDWGRSELLYSTHLNANKVEKASYILYKHEIDFFVHSKIPYNHKFDFYYFGDGEPDTWRRINLYDNYARQINNFTNYSFKDSSQVIGISKQDKNLYLSIDTELSDLNVIRTTSPLDNESMWLEIFPNDVSKSKTCKKLCQRLNISTSRTIGIGNDYNDRDLLKWTEESYVMQNAPEELKEEFITTASNDENGFSKVVSSILNKTNVS